MKPALFLDCRTDFLAHAPHIGKIQITVELEGVPTQISEISDPITASRTSVVARNFSRCRSLGDHLADIFLDDGGDALVDQVHLGLVRVHADHVMAIAGQTPGGNRAHIAQAENTDAHESIHPYEKKKAM